MTADPTLQQEAYEALCSALFNTAFEPIGEVEEQGRITTYFHRGVRPKDIRVAVARSHIADLVEVRVEWRNLSSGTVLKAEQTFTLSSLQHRSSVVDQATQVIVKVLEIFRDVVSGEGVAGPLEKLVDSKPEQE